MNARSDARVRNRLDGDIDAYLDVIASIRGRRGRRRPLHRLESDLAEVNRRLEEPSIEPLQKLKLLQHRIDIHKALAQRRPERQLPELEERFIAVAARYARATGRSYSWWRQAGVPVNVLRRAGLHPTQQPPAPTTTPFHITRLLPRRS